MFLVKASQLGFTVCLPHGDSAPYDCVIDNGDRLIKIQVKSTSKKTSRGDYQIACAGGRMKKRAYKNKEFDFMAIHVIDKDLWYILPISELRGRVSLRLNSSLDPFKENWDILC